MGNALQAAIQAFQQRRFVDAEKHCRSAIGANADDASAWNLLGAICGTLGRHEDAEQHMRHAVKLAPGNDSYRRNLVTALLSQGNFAEAEEALRQSPSGMTPALLVSLGTALGGQGKLVEGIEALEQAIAQMPNSAFAHYNIAELYRRNQDRDKAIVHLQKVLQLQPDHFDAMNNLSGTLLDNGSFVDALRCIQRMLKINRKSAQAYANLATILRAAGDLHESVKAIRNAIRLSPREDRFQFQLANMLVAVGRLDEADEIMDDLRKRLPDRAALQATHAKILERKGETERAAEILEAFDEEARLVPDNATITATVLDQLGRTDEAISLLEEVVQTNEAVAIEGIAIQFLLAQFYDSSGRYDEAFAMLRQGNRNRRSAFYQSEKAASMTKVVDRLTSSIYQHEYYSDFPESNLSSEKPVFIIGMPRSGTSLMEQILASHSRVFGAGELTEMNDFIAASHATPATGQNGAPFRIIEDDPSGETMGLLPKGWESPKAESLDEIGKEYLQCIEKLAPDVDRVVDKMPYNFLLAPMIRRIFPGARIIHMKRHPLDTCLSCYFQNFAAGNQYAFELAELGDYYANYVRLMRHWRSIGVQMLEVNYEDLVTDTEDVARRVFDYCGLQWEPHVLEFHKSRRVVSTASYQQVRKPVYQKSSGRWRNYEAHIGELIAAIGINPALFEHRSPDLEEKSTGVL